MSNDNKELTPDIDLMLDEAFNEGVDQCIGLVEGLFVFGTPSKQIVIDTLNKLKKP